MPAPPDDTFVATALLCIDVQPVFVRAIADGARVQRRCEFAVAAAHGLGLAISGTGVRNDFTAADPKIRTEGVQRIKTWIEVAAKLGAPTVRAFADSQPPFRNWQQAANNAPRDTVEGYLADALRECAEHGKKFGVIVAVQNHGDFINTGPEHLSLLKRVDHEWCAAMVDT
eukprot:gene8655-11016_t